MSYSVSALYHETIKRLEIEHIDKLCEVLDCCHHNIYWRFRELLLQAGIPHAGRGNGPRIHDVRHTFACHTLQEADKHHVDLYAALPVLSTYMGHESIQATSQYLRMTAEIYPNITDAVNALCSYIIPEVKV